MLCFNLTKNDVFKVKPHKESSLSLYPITQVKSSTFLGYYVGEHYFDLELEHYRCIKQSCQ